MTEETRLKTCIEDEGCEAPGVEIITDEDCYLLDEKYASSIVIGSGTDAHNVLCKDRKAFWIEDYPNLKSITIGDYVCSNLAYVGQATQEVAFRNCPNLETIEIGNNQGKTFTNAHSLYFESIIIKFY